MNEQTENVIKKIAYDVILTAAKDRIVKAYPWLGGTIINPIFGFILGKIFGLFYDEMIKIFDNFLIDQDMAKKNEQYQAAVLTLKQITDKPKEEQDAYALQAAKDDFRRTLGNLIRMRKS